MKPASFFIDIHQGELNTALLRENLESHARSLAEKLTPLAQAGQSPQAWSEYVKNSARMVFRVQQVSASRVEVQAPPQELAALYGHAGASWGMLLEEVAGKCVTPGSQLTLDWSSSGFEDLEAMGFLNGSGPQVPAYARFIWPVTALVIALLVIGIPIYSVWRMKVAAEEKLQAVTDVVEEINDVVKDQGKKIERIYDYAALKGGSAWTALQDGIGGLFSSEEDSTEKK